MDVGWLIRYPFAGSDLYTDVWNISMTEHRPKHCSTVRSDLSPVSVLRKPHMLFRDTAEYFWQECETVTPVLRSPRNLNEYEKDKPVYQNRLRKEEAGKMLLESSLPPGSGCSKEFYFDINTRHHDVFKGWGRRSITDETLFQSTYQSNLVILKWLFCKFARLQILKGGTVHTSMVIFASFLPQ